MEVSLIMQENYRPGIHLGIFMIHLTPPRRFYDGHIIQKEFGQGSRTHRTINRLFDTHTRAVVLQATQYQFLEYLADYDEAFDLLHELFMDADFTTMRFSYDPAGDTYVVNPDALDDHELHCCAEEQYNDDNGQNDNDDNRQNDNAPEQEEEEEEVIAIPPPPPIHDLGEIYRRNLALFYAHDIDERWNPYLIRNYERPQYINNIAEYGNEDQHPVQG